jgi:hypothetical protein
MNTKRGIRVNTGKLRDIKMPLASLRFLRSEFVVKRLILLYSGEKTMINDLI